MTTAVSANDGGPAQGVRVPSNQGVSFAGKLLQRLTPTLRRFDIRVSRWSRSYAYHRIRYLRQAGVSGLVDVGANVGQYASQLRADGYPGRLLSIEPELEAFGLLAMACAADPAWECRRCALGAHEGVSTLMVSANSFSNSMLPMLESHVSAAPESHYVGTERVDLLTLDAVAGDWPFPGAMLGLKLDVQGYEAQVLAGAGAILPRVAFIEMELSLIPLYDGQSTYRDLIERTEEYGFSLVNVEPSFFDPRTGRVLQMDGMFLRSA